MTEYVIRLVASERESLADVADTMAVFAQVIAGTPPGKYLVWSDPDANGGDGAETWSDDPVKAKRFRSRDAAFACWRARSKVTPTRPDGRPNRPMTAYSITIEPAP
jgi:hypothetical protein